MTDEIPPREKATEPRPEPTIEHQVWMLDDIADRDAQTKPITKPEDLPLGRDGTKYDHARWQASEYHLDTHSLALGDRHLLLREVRRLRAEAAPGAAPRAEGPVEGWPKPGHYGTCAVNRGKECTCYPPGAAPRAERPKPGVVRWTFPKDSVTSNDDGSVSMHVLPSSTVTVVCPRCESDTCPGRADVRNCTLIIEGAAPRAEGLDPLFLMDDMFAQAVENVFAAPGDTDFHHSPARGYYHGDTHHFIDLLRAEYDRLSRPSDEKETQRVQGQCDRFRHDEHCAHLHES